MTAFILYKAMMCVGVFVLCLAAAAYATLWERKFAAFLQDRKGPSRAGWGGILQPLADGVKMFMKEKLFLMYLTARYLYLGHVCL